MLNHRYRFVAGAAGSIIAIWLAATAAHWYFETLKVTADKVAEYVESVDFGKLTGAARAEAIKRLEDKINALSYDERQRLNRRHLTRDWFAEMTDDEKAQFLDATLPSGFKQMISAFEQMPEEKRHKTIDDAMRRLRDESARAADDPAAGATNSPPVSPQLETQIRQIGLSSFYSQSSAQTKAEAAPLLEELQRVMESGRMQFRQ
jgi:hypothetical protein